MDLVSGYTYPVCYILVFKLFNWSCFSLNNALDGEHSARLRLNCALLRVGNGGFLPNPVGLLQNTGTNIKIKQNLGIWYDSQELFGKITKTNPFTWIMDRIVYTWL